ncbi:unnamed protein product [Acanthosepion pharaonis]|uniref:Uncharacterized protein n=1 Tax=Acanthosepion pharaonis TaxID=158019 RepID=A0A812CVR8_ACAPH|nr:unnamed protein product [Sepia pharaonis]
MSRVILPLCISCLLMSRVILPSVSLVFNVPCDSSLCISCLQCPRVILPSVSLVSLPSVFVFNVPCDSSLCISCLQCPVCSSLLSLCLNVFFPSVFNVPCDSSPLYLLSSMSRVILPLSIFFDSSPVLSSFLPLCISCLLLSSVILPLCISFSLQCPVPFFPSVSYCFNSFPLYLFCLQCPV